MKSVLYARVSSREQEETGYSLPAQEELLQKYAERLGLEIVKVFSVAESANGTKQRQVFGEMIEYMQKKGIPNLLCEKVDRLTRNLKEAVVVNDWVEQDPSRRIHFVKQNLVIHKGAKSDEKFRWDIEIVLAKKYISNLSEEVKKGQAEKIRQGWLPTKPPLGYLTVGEAGKKIHVLDKEKAALLTKMFELYSTGLYSLQRLCDEISRNGLRTRGGSRLVKSRLAELLGDPFYCGQIRWNGEIYEGKHTPLISKELYSRVQNVLHQKNTPKYSKHEYLFKGLIKCSECSGAITWEVQKGLTYGHCNYYRECVRKKWLKEPDIDSQIAKAFSLLKFKNERLAGWITSALKQNHSSEIEFRLQAKKEINNQLNRVNQRLDRLYEDRLDGRVDTDTYDRKATELKKERATLENEASRHDQAGDDNKELGVSVLELSQRAESLYKAATMEEKRRLIKLAFETLEIKEGILHFKYSQPFALLAEAVLSTNSSKVANSIKSPIQIFELFNDGSTKGKRGLSSPLNPVWLRG